MINIPTITEIYENISNDLKNNLNISDTDLKKVLDAFALSLSGQFKLTYLYLADIQNNLSIDKADSSENGGTLERQGLIYLNRIRRPATGSKININIISEIGSVLRQGLTFKSNDDSFNPGQLYVLDEEIISSNENQIIEIRSLNTGSLAALQVNDTLTITEPVIGVNQIVTVNEVTEQPLEAESIENYRSAILQSIQSEPNGGSKIDYRLWAADAQGVRLVYVYVKEGEAGTVQVFVEATEADSVDGFGTPSQALLDSVLEVIEFNPDTSIDISYRGRRPIQASVEVLPISLNPVDITISNLNVNTTDIRNDIRVNLEDFLKNIRPYIAGADIARNKNDILYSAKLQTVVSEIIEPSNFFTDFSMFVNGVNYLTYPFSGANIPYLRNLLFE